MDDIASKLEIGIENYSFPSNELVGEILFQDDRPIIRINPARNQYEPRRRFTIAHEIGHYCLHSAKSKKGFKDSKKAMSRTESYWDIEKSEANSFAANLLMPASLIYDAGKEVIKAYKDLTNATKIPVGVFTETMADKFVVSNKAMEYRLRNLKIVRN
uniref:IrrE N-terminal-like domain-containing protein n=1 Tax=Candidatus Kentrum sp. LFY TaxID=2126342 RepID=A0A450U8Y0_9GAMM|nr:MAG: protein of unknown function (DUF955) [Candidatus Kentron sp. LFY]